MSNKPANKGSQRSCDFADCSEPAKRTDIPTNWFRGDDVVLNLCAAHRKEAPQVLLALPKAKKQMEAL